MSGTLLRPKSSTLGINAELTSAEAIWGRPISAVGGDFWLITPSENRGKPELLKLGGVFGSIAAGDRVEFWWLGNGGGLTTVGNCGTGEVAFGGDAAGVGWKRTDL